MERTQAMELLREYTQSESLIKHALAVEAAMRHYAGLLDGDVEEWGLTGLLHDFDYERWPEEPEHTREGAKILRERGVSEEVIGAILSHAEWNREEYPLDRSIRKALFAVDELCGFLTAVTLVRPGKSIAELPVKSVKKKLKDKAFARNVNREDIRRGLEELEVELSDHIAFVRDAMVEVATELGLVGDVEA